MSKIRKIKPPSLPQLIDRKIYKTGQTRGADDDEIYQNRVSRRSTVLIPYYLKDKIFSSLAAGENFEKGYIVLISPREYFPHHENPMIFSSQGLILGENMLIFYELRDDWVRFNPASYGFTEATNRSAPLGGQFVARIPATTSVDNGQKIAVGYHTTKPKGAGIRYYEYASESTILNTRIQLEALFWLCCDSIEVVVDNGMSRDDAIIRRQYILLNAENGGLLDYAKLANL